MKKLFVVDDHFMIREGIKSYIERNSDWNVAFHCKSREEYFEKISDCSFQNIFYGLVDVDLGTESGFELVKEIKKNQPEIKCIMYSMHNESCYVMEALESGAWGYVSKASDEKEFLNSLNAVFEGQPYTDKNLSDKHSRLLEVMDLLTQREQQVFKLILKSLNAEEIASILNLKKHSVDIYLTGIYEKTFCKTRQELLEKYL